MASCCRRHTETVFPQSRKEHLEEAFKVWRTQEEIVEAMRRDATPDKSSKAKTNYWLPDNLLSVYR